MRTSLLILMFIAFGCSSTPNDSGSDNPRNAKPPSNEIESSSRYDLSVIEIPRPNSGTFTTEEAEKLLASTLARAVGVAADSKFISEWNKPAHGLRVYVNADGEINTVDFLDRPSTGMKGLYDALELSRAMQYGNPLSVLVASETVG